MKKIFVTKILVMFLCLFARGSYADNATNNGKTGGTLKYGGGIIISTIDANSAWPYTRPSGLEGRLGYGPNESPSDDQIVLDVCLQVENGTLFIALDTTLILANGLQKPTGGSLTNATWADRRWVTLAMLRRSTNNPPPSSFSIPELQTYASGVETSAKCRLLNNLRIRARVQNNKFVSDVYVYDKRALIGGTALDLDPSVTFKDKNGKKYTIGDLNIPIPNNLGGAENWGNDLTKGGKAGDGKVAHRNASRIGPLLMGYEDYILNNIQPPPFYNEVILSLQQGNLHVEDVVSNQRSNVTDDFKDKETGVTWPTHSVYVYSHRTKKYNKTAIRPQIDSPFHGFIPDPS